MTTGYIAAVALALLIGFLLGSMGSGGSILTLPVLVYVAGVAPQSAVPMSLAIVGTTSVLAAYLHARRHNFNAKAALLLGATGMIGAYLGSAGTQLVSSRTLMLIFAGLLLVVGIVMFRGSVAGLPPGICRPLRCLTVGAAVGVLGSGRRVSDCSRAGAVRRFGYEDGDWNVTSHHRLELRGRACRTSAICRTRLDAHYRSDWSGVHRYASGPRSSRAPFGGNLSQSICFTPSRRRRGHRSSEHVMRRAISVPAVTTCSHPRPAVLQYLSEAGTR